MSGGTGQWTAEGKAVMSKCPGNNRAAACKVEKSFSLG
jgi:hypothetical protein